MLRRSPGDHAPNPNPGRNRATPLPTRTRNPIRVNVAPLLHFCLHCNSPPPSATHRSRLRTKESGIGTVVAERDGESKDYADGEIAQVKTALVGAGARILFYPTLVHNLIRNKVEAQFHWWDEVDQFILLGGVPFAGDVPRLKQLGVRGVITLSQPYETLVPSSLYQVHGIDHLVIPTTDYLFAPSPMDISRAVDFIHGNASCGKTTYVHCKAGRGRSTTIVLCYLVEHKNMTPEAALEHVRSRRPRVQLAPSQWRAVQEHSRCKLELPAVTPSTACFLTGDEVLLTETDLEGYDLDEDFEGFNTPSSKMLACSIGDDEVLVSEADLEGYDAFTNAGQNKCVSSNETMMKKLSVLCSSLKYSSDTCSRARENTL